MNGDISEWEQATAQLQAANPWKNFKANGDDWRHPDDVAAHKAPVVMPPQPWLGNLSSANALWLLGGFGTSSSMAWDMDGGREIVREWALCNLRTISAENLWLRSNDDPVIGRSSDVDWWSRVTKALRSAYVPAPEWENADSTARSRLSLHLFVLESYPYPAKYNPKRKLETHKFQADIVRAFLDTDKPIVLQRGEKFWCEICPELTAAIASRRVVKANSVQYAGLTKGNLPPGEWDRLLYGLQR